MAKTMKAVDAVMVGMGWSGSIMARELTKAGLTVVGLERGADRSPSEDFALPRIHTAQIPAALELMLDTAVETHTFRNSPSELALPMRRWEVPPLGCAFMCGSSGRRSKPIPSGRTSNRNRHRLSLEGAGLNRIDHSHGW